MSESLIDILMATYNGERFVGEQIESIQRQTYKDWRLLVSDDCSTDGTLDIVRKHAAEDDRICIVSEGVKHVGAKENFFALMEFSEAPYCMFCDQDDVWDSEKVERGLQAMLENEATLGANFPLMVHSDLELIDSRGASMNRRMSQTIGADPKTATALQLLVTGVATGCTIAVNRACLSKALECKCHDGVILHDWWIALVAAFFGKRIYIDSPLVSYRQHGDNVVGAAITPFGDMARDYVATGKRAGFNGIIGRIVVMEVDRIRQAKLFLETYDADLNFFQKKEIRAITEISDAGLFRRFALINTHRLWRRGFKWKVRQFLALAFIRWGAACGEMREHK